MAPLEGLRVLQLSTGFAAEMVGLALADLGADVVVCGASSRDTLSAVLERGKRITDIGARDENLFVLARTADVVIEPQQTPFELDTFFSAAAIRLSLPAFPAGDPRFLGKAEDEGTVLAAAGVLAERGPNNRLRGLGPTLMPMPIASAYAAAFGTLGILAAVFARQTSGRGELLEVSLFGAIMEGFSYNHVKVNGLPARYADPRGIPADSDLPLQEWQVQSLIDPLYRAFECADGAWFYVATAAHLGLVERTLRLFGIWDELVADGLPTDHPYLSTRGWKDKTEGSIFAYPQLAPHWREKIRKAVDEAIRTQPAWYWEKAFAEGGLCGTQVRSSAEWLNTNEARAAGLVVELIDPLLGPIKCPGPFCWVNGNIALKPREIVEGDAIAWRSKPWAFPIETGSPKPLLSGVRVLDLCNVIAGPTVAGCLTRFGADVIKIDSPRPGFDPFITVILSLQSARGKESVLLDLASSEGKNAFERLVASADLVTFNGPQTQIDSLGIDIDALSAINPRIVLTQVSAFGGPKPGPLADRKGVDEVLQAATGVMHRLRPANAPPEEYAHFGTIDVATGVWGSAISIAALIDARRNGRGSQVGTSLAAGAAAVQMPFLWASEKEGAAPDSGDANLPAASGEIDGSFYVGPGGHRELLAHYVDLRKRLALTGAEAKLSVGFESHADHPIGLLVELVTQCAIVCKSSPTFKLSHPRKYGADTRKVLMRYGLSEREIDHLMAIGVASAKWPNHDQFLPD